jgi:hypothetical protein
MRLSTATRALKTVPKALHWSGESHSQNMHHGTKLWRRELDA